LLFFYDLNCGTIISYLFLSDEFISVNEEQYSIESFEIYMSIEDDDKLLFDLIDDIYLIAIVYLSLSLHFYCYILFLLLIFKFNY